MKKLILTLLLSYPVLISIEFYTLDTNPEKKNNTLLYEVDHSADKMRAFIIQISEYAKESNPQFNIIPQNGIELCFNELESSKGIHQQYVSAIDGIGVESLFYPNKRKDTREKLKALNLLKGSKKIFVSDYTKNEKRTERSFTKNNLEGFTSFPRKKGNYDYSFIPAFFKNENNRDIKTLSDVSNYLYLINFSNFNSKKELIDELKNTNYDLLLIDLFFDKTPFTSKEIDELKIKKNGSKRLVVSYINIGAAEKFRYYWNSKWKLGSPSWLKKEYEGYRDEYWVQFWEKPWQKIIYGNDDSYIKKIIDVGFDGAYLDNVECYYFLDFD